MAKAPVSDILLFDVVGPLVVPFHNGDRGGKYIASRDGARFFDDNSELRRRRGCYVFGIRSGGGIIPWYVGKTISAFESECFQSHKLVQYNEALQLGGIGTPVLFFVVHPPARGPVSVWTINDLESYLIQAAYKRNERLQNKTKRGVQYWGIPGANVPGRGRATNAAVSLGQSLGLSY